MNPACFSIWPRNGLRGLLCRWGHFTQVGRITFGESLHFSIVMCLFNTYSIEINYPLPQDKKKPCLLVSAVMVQEASTQGCTLCNLIPVNRVYTEFAANHQEVVDLLNFVRQCQSLSLGTFQYKEIALPVIASFCISACFFYISFMDSSELSISPRWKKRGLQHSVKGT